MCSVVASGKAMDDAIVCCFILTPVGLALFTIVGVQVALSAGMTMVNAILLGCITGVAGGMFRDLLCGLQPIRIAARPLRHDFSCRWPVLCARCRLFQP